MVEHGEHCDADLRRDGCVCDDAAAIADAAAAWADEQAKREIAETERLAAEAFA